MTQKIILTGDVNLMNVTDAAVPFARVAPEFRSADFVFSNLECCLYDPPHGDSVDVDFKSEGFFAPSGVGGNALKISGIQAVGVANNVNYGEAAIKATLTRLDELRILHTGAGANRDAAYAPIIMERAGVRVGVLQRTSVYWPTNHEATAKAAGVAIIRGNTAYQVPLHKTRPEMSPCNRPGLPPIILTWVDPPYLQLLKDDVAALRAKSDFVVVSCHWGWHEDVLDYMTEIAHAAIDAGADVVTGHGPHYSLPIEVYKGKPVYYGLGGFSFHTGHGGIKHGNWVGMMARIMLEGTDIKSATFQFVRHNDNNETVLCALADERAMLDNIVQRSRPYGTQLTPRGDEVAIGLNS